MGLVIAHKVVMNNKAVILDKVLLQGKEHLSPEDLYHDRKWSYPKFFKMDKLCKWAFAGAELLLSGGELYHGLDKNRIGLVLATKHGCIDVDKRFQETLSMPSPALFVYTLPNIMLGEICIRHGFKGSQLSMVSEAFDAEEVWFATDQLFRTAGLEACLCGWVDVTADDHDVRLFWVTNGASKATPFTPAALMAP